MGDNSPLTTVHRAFEILNLLGKADGANLTELAERLDLPTSTVHDYVRTLSETKYVIREGNEYYLSYHFHTVSGKMKQRNRLFQFARGEMERAADETEELVGLTIHQHDQAIILHQERGRHALSLGTYPGATTPLHTIASGKAILANLPTERAEALLHERELEQRTEQTIADPEALEQELDVIREQGYAIDWDEQVIGMGMAAVPLVIDEEVLGAFAIAVPSRRIRDESYQEDLVRHLQEMQDTVTINYQYGESPL